jgi:glycosyltransferase involved in cell wall biosynthesis
MKKVILLKTDQNLVWTSMQEILPCIYEAWTCASQQSDIELITINVDEEKPQAFVKELLSCDLIVVTAFNGKVAQFLSIVRKHLRVDCPWYFYMHSLATVGLWPLHLFGLCNLINTNDTFVGTCEGDRLCLKASYPIAEYKEGIFFTDKSLSELPQLKKKAIRDIVYVGRISRQKNLHSLLMAFKLLKMELPDISLHLYGEEDNLGCPNMGLRKPGYLSELQKLLRDQQISGVIFHGFVNRNEIEEQWVDKDFVFCSPSLHSDENFGMAALGALEQGGGLVLSEWGGHKNYISKYPDRVKGVPVKQGTFGPFIEISSLKVALKEALNHAGSKSTRNFATKDHAVELVKQFLNSKPKKPLSLAANSFIEEMLKTRKKNADLGDLYAQKVFLGFEDPYAHLFFKCYGATTIGMKELPFDSKLVPWARYLDTQKLVVEVNDPHKGDWSGSAQEAFENGYFF